MTPLSVSLSAVVAWQGELPCTKYDCECAFTRQRGCCCAAHELQEEEDQIFIRMMDLSNRVSQLGDSILELIGTLDTDRKKDLEFCNHE